MNIFIVFLSFILLIFIGLANFYLYKFYVDKKYVEDYWEFNLKSVGHSKEIFKILLNKSGSYNKNASKVKKFVLASMGLLVILLYLTF